jgi:predicted kinase
MVGLPRSGKSTRARELAHLDGSPIVCPDAVRLALHGQRFVASAEPFVWAIARTMVEALFLAGHDSVIVDATHGTRKRRDFWKATAAVPYKRAFLTIDTPRAVCLERAVKEGDTEIVPVIERMAAAWEPVAAEELAS